MGVNKKFECRWCHSCCRRDVWLPFCTCEPEIGKAAKCVTVSAMGPIGRHLCQHAWPSEPCHARGIPRGGLDDIGTLRRRDRRERTTNAYATTWRRGSPARAVSEVPREGRDERDIRYNRQVTLVLPKQTLMLSGEDAEYTSGSGPTLVGRGSLGVRF